jgi:hypothetical protein
MPPIVAHPKRISEESDSFHPMTSYSARGSNTYELGPFLLFEKWSQGGNDAHTLGPPSITMSIAPPGVPEDPTWEDPIFSGPDYDRLGERLALRHDGADIYVLDLNLWGGGEAWKPFRDKDQQLAFRLLRHSGGHRGAPRHPVGVTIALLSFGLAVWRLASARRGLAISSWVQGTIDERGRIVAEDGTDSGGVSDATWLPGTTVLFIADANTEGYRTMARPPQRIVAASRSQVLRALKRDLWTASAAIALAAVCAAITGT